MRGLIKKKASNEQFFNTLDELFDIPKPKEKPTMTEEELVSDFEKYIGA